MREIKKINGKNACYLLSIKKYIYVSALAQSTYCFPFISQYKFSSMNKRALCRYPRALQNWKLIGKRLFCCCRSRMNALARTPNLYSSDYLHSCSGQRQKHKKKSIQKQTIFIDKFFVGKFCSRGRKKMFNEIGWDRDWFGRYTNEMNKSYCVYAELIRLSLDNGMREKAKN